jgi:hypothetical protein
MPSTNLTSSTNQLSKVTRSICLCLDTMSSPFPVREPSEDPHPNHQTLRPRCPQNPSARAGGGGEKEPGRSGEYCCRNQVRYKSQQSGQYSTCPFPPIEAQNERHESEFHSFSHLPASTMAQVFVCSHVHRLDNGIAQTQLASAMPPKAIEAAISRLIWLLSSQSIPTSSVLLSSWS